MFILDIPTISKEDYWNIIACARKKDLLISSKENEF